MSRTAILFDNFGPYHLARLQAAAAVTDLLAVEVAARSGEYAWKSRERSAERGDWKIVTLLEAGTSREVSHRELTARLNRALDDFRPQVVFIPGWSSQAAFAALSWCVRQGVPAVVMSESTEWDEARSAWREAVKRRIVGLCSTALVGGQPHKDYMVKLGMPPERVFLGYDAVDNSYFAAEAAKWQKQPGEVEGQTLHGPRKSEVRRKFGLPENYFLASARFVEQKNLPRLIEAYARYRELVKKAENLPGEVEKQTLHGPRKAGDTSPRPSPQGGEGVVPWELVLLGDGALRPTLTALRAALGLDACVHLPGFKQYPDLPAYYGLANAFIHASTKEPWGLVVNEAMASGLPVLVSNRCGCAPDLVKDGMNGFTFDPYGVEQLADLMLKVSAFNFPLSAFADASKRIVADWGPERFAAGLKAAADKAVEVGPQRASWMARLLVRALLLR
jgi:1,2-diacylglycerol 3-alpha-glucosyltransferase